MTFFFRSLPISCEIMPFYLALYVTRKGLLCGASLRNSSFNPCLAMSRLYLSEVILLEFSRELSMLPAWKLSALLIDFFIIFFNLRHISRTWFSNFCAGNSVYVLAHVLASSESGFFVEILCKTLSKFFEFSWFRLKSGL